ncbi:heat-shock protein Hsp20 [Desulfonema ishimotonii]|uniref:Heat-shock protein Hsp20 n=1 Tax=Desulfonema ishimotonii TaxID=45657 RepID=A0A401G417_9BACT|nr:Hsp20/alpha crystallin family protein [Desulfonema ishimotonii]GBC63931.1 heat-shock protein Hsp20 [Desulfonema ishimotonii]
MDYIKIRFGNDLDNLNAQFEKNIEEMFRAISPRFTCAECSWTPPMDIYETPEEIVILAEIAGVNKEDLDIEINSKAVKIKGKRFDIPRVENATYRLAEIQCGQFERILFLPAPINTEKVSASYVDGMLHVRLAKMPREKTHKITISDG